MSYKASRAVLLLSGAAALAVLGVAADSAADVQHVVARGHTIEAIAHRYHVQPKAILDANHLKDARHLKVGETLTIPGVQAKAAGAAGAKTAPAAGKPGKPAPPPTYAMRAKDPGVVHARRLATNESFAVKVSDKKGKASPVALK